MVLCIFLHEGNMIVRSGTCWSRGRGGNVRQRMLRLCFLSVRTWWRLSGALLQHRHPDPAGRIWETRLLSKCTDNLQTLSIAAAKCSWRRTGQECYSLPGLHIPLRDRSFPVESIGLAREAVVLGGLSVTVVTSLCPRAVRQCLEMGHWGGEDSF